MRAVVQRVRSARVIVSTATIGKIDQGLLILLGITHSDTVAQADWLAEKVLHLRIFEDDAGKMNRDLLEQNGQILVVSQFTLYGDCQKGRRPSFIDAARPEQAEPLYRRFVDALRMHGIAVETGQFGAEMQVELVNNGPVTLIVDTPSPKPSSVKAD